MLRAHLIMNPEARGVTPSLQHLMTTAMQARFRLGVTETHARDVGVEVARHAVDKGAQLLIAFGGDGLVNEVVNGMAGSDATLAIIPGGTMNVFARNLGIPTNPTEAANYILSRAGFAAPRRMALGLANDRHFTFACGCGFDAEAAARVEAHRSAKRRYGEPYFYAAALATFAASYALKKPFLSCEGDFGTEEAVMAIGLVSDTYAYLVGRRLRLAHAGSPSGKLGLFLIRKLRATHLPRYAFGAVTGRFGSGAVSLADVDEFTVTGQGPVAYHVDGETMEPAEKVYVRQAPCTLSVLA